MQYTKVQMASLLYAATDDVDDADGDDGDDDDDNDDDSSSLCGGLAPPEVVL